MAFCPECGKKLPQGATFCAKCGAKIKKEESSAKNEQKPAESPPKPAEKPVSETAPKQSGSGSKAGWACGICAIIFAIVVVVFVIIGFFALAFIGAKGQPGTVIKPTEIKTPQQLTATGSGDKEIDLAWKKSDSSDVKKYSIYKSTKNAKDYQKVSTIETADLKYKDTAVTKGITYYYVVTAATSDGKESGNSNQVSYALESQPIIPQGVTSWQDVLTKYNADTNYANVLTKVTNLSKSDIEKYVELEKKGKKLKTTLKKGTHITNTTENYKIIPDYVLTKDKEFLTDDKGVAHIMIWCGNPIKVLKKQTTFSQVVQSVQKVTTNIIYILPAPVTNIFINAAQPVSTFVVGILPNSFGPTVMNPEDTDTRDQYPEGEVLVDYADDLGVPNGESLEEGQKWAVEGKILLEANPHDPGPGESVTMTITIFPAQEGVDVEYHVSGTDGYTAGSTVKTNAEGKIQFHIPGGASGVTDTINVKVPSTGTEGSTSYVF